MQLTALDSLAGSDLRQPRKIDAIIGANVLVVNGGCAGQPQQPCPCIFGPSSFILLIERYE